jgi:hypothetical protein
MQSTTTSRSLSLACRYLLRITYLLHYRFTRARARQPRSSSMMQSHYRAHTHHASASNKIDLSNGRLDRSTSTPHQFPCGRSLSPPDSERFVILGCEATTLILKACLSTCSAHQNTPPPLVALRCAAVVNSSLLLAVCVYLCRWRIFTSPHDPSLYIPRTRPRLRLLLPVRLDLWPTLIHTTHTPEPVPSALWRPLLRRPGAASSAPSGKPAIRRGLVRRRAKDRGRAAPTSLRCAATHGTPGTRCCTRITITSKISRLANPRIKIAHEL